VRGWLAVAWLACACACGPSEAPPATRSQSDVTGMLTVDGAPAQLVRCRPGHAANVFVEVDTSLGTLRFGDGKLSWQGQEQMCRKLDRSWGGGIRRDGTAYFRGTLAFRCDKLTGSLALDCGQISPEEGAELARNHAAAKPQGPPTPGSAPLPPAPPAPPDRAPAGSAGSPNP
jgi:hypothetical protein